MAGLGWGQVAFSENGMDWEITKLDTYTGFTSILWDGEKFILAGSDNGPDAYISYDGRNWQK